MIDLNALDRLTRDRLIMMEESGGDFFSNALEIDYTDSFLELLDERRKKGGEQSFIADFYGMQGSGKSYAGLFTAGYLDPDFSGENIFFDYNKLVNDRLKLKPHTAVLVDEQSDPFGIDSVRVGIILRALKEQLRKKSIHFLFCSPVLREYASSMFCLQTLFLDKEMKESYLAFRTNQLQCLGYVCMPHPLTVLSKKILLEYEKLKDEHLARLVDQPVDDVEERAKVIMKNKDFLTAEKVYLDKVGFVPYRTLVQIVNRIFPEFKGSVIVYELCDRIRLLCEISGRWLIASKAWEKKKLEGEDKKDAKAIPDDVESGDNDIDRLKSIKKKYEPKIKSSQLDMIKEKLSGGVSKLPSKRKVGNR